MGNVRTLNENVLIVFHLDYLSCVLTILSTLLVGKKLWFGWVVAAANSIMICFIGLRTAQFGFIPANLFCLVLYGWNLRKWARAEHSNDVSEPRSRCAPHAQQSLAS